METKTPLRDFLARRGINAEAFASDHQLSPWSVRHWARGDKMPQLEAQRRLEAATDGEVTPADWLAYSLARPSTEERAA
jgi:hypothetical protein